MYVSLGSRMTHLKLGHLICRQFAQCDLSRADLSKLPQHGGWLGISLSPQICAEIGAARRKASCKSLLLRHRFANGIGVLRDFHDHVHAIGLGGYALIQVKTRPTAVT
jgi:hypothetical protein